MTILLAVSATINSVRQNAERRVRQAVRYRNAPARKVAEIGVKHHVEERWHHRGIGSWRVGGAGGWGVLVTVARDGTLLDRRRVDLVGEGLPKIPHHSEGQGLPLDEAVDLVERVRVSAGGPAGLALDAVT